MAHACILEREIAGLRAELAALAESGTGYSQQTVDAITQERDSLRAEIFAAKARTCSWTEDGEGNWETACGDMHILNEGGPTDNDMEFCCYCGATLGEVREGAHDE